MSQPPAHYTFLSWLRRGVATQITRRESSVVDRSARARLPIRVGFNADTIVTTTTLDLLGAGEVTGFDAHCVIRTWPPPDVFDAESNFFPLIEFDQADLPWRLTPARAESNQRLRPWLALVVVKDGEATMTPARGDGVPAVLSVASADSLPDLSQAWAWAHAQVSGETNIPADRVAQLLESEPSRVRSRIICPRQLEPNAMYTACLVPALERGRLAGLRLPLDDSINGLEPAWSHGQGSAVLPVFYHWRFHTGEAGDFEALVRKLEPRVLPATVGTRAMDVSDPGGALRGVAAHDAPLGLQGALKTATTQSTPWPPSPTRTRFLDRLKALLDLPTVLLHAIIPIRAVAPPLYGRWYAAAQRLEPGARPVWFNELNQDPRLRVAAGLGTQVVRQEQRNLMAAAWQQVEGIRKANEELRLAQLARGIAERLYARHVKTGDVEQIVRLTAPVHARVKASPRTVRAVLDECPVPRALLDAQFQRVTRPLGPLGRRQARPATAQTRGLLDRLNTGDLTIAAAPTTPATLPTFAQLGSALVPAPTPGRFANLRSLPPWFVALVLILAVALLIVLGPVAIGAVLAAAAAAWFLARPWVNEIIAALRAALVRENALTRAEARAQAVRSGRVTTDLIIDSPQNPDFQLRPAPSNGLPIPLPVPTRPGVADNADARMFRGLATELFTHLEAQPAPATKLYEVALDELGNQLINALDPRTTIATAVRSRLKLDPAFDWKPADPIEPVMKYPVFDRPMYEPLRDLGQDWLLPGLDQIPVNTVALVLTNQPFVEAYLVGLNHELGRELLWNEYLTDQRGTYFRQFWDARGAEPAPGRALDLETRKDIHEIHRWRATARLGQNSPRPPMPGGEDRVVLLLRGDLLRRYPNTEVYAQRAKVGHDSRRDLHDERSHPICRGTLRPDVTFFGFDLTRTQVIGAQDPTDANADQGWFFVLEEQSAEPRFGLEVATTFGGLVSDFNNLSWGHLAASAADLADLLHIDLNLPLPDTRPISDPGAPAWHADRGLGRTQTRSADIAAITLQRPVRIAIHASDMLRGAS